MTDYKMDESKSGALKHAEGKCRLELVPSEMILGIGEVLTYGASKYEDNNWCKGHNFSVLHASAMRHILKFHSGVDLDDESGIHHLKHAITNLGMIIYHVENNRKDLDDRYKVEEVTINNTTDWTPM